MLKFVTTTRACLYYQLLGRGRYWKNFYWIAWISILIRLYFYKKVSVDSGIAKEQQTWSSQQGNSKRNGKNKMWTSTLPLSTSPKHSTQSVVMGFGNLWQSLAVQPGSKQWCGSFMMASRMVESTQNHFWWQMESKKAVYWHRHCSAWCSLPCLHLLFKIVMLAFQSDSALMANCSTKKVASQI